jgi:hypothetical protein
MRRRETRETKAATEETAQEREQEINTRASNHDPQDDVDDRPDWFGERKERDEPGDHKADYHDAAN